MNKKLCTLFLLLVLAIQILPIKQMGRMLFGNQFTEEIPHSCDTGKGCFKKAELKSDYLYTPNFSIASAFISSSTQHFYFTASIPLNHTDDIHVPPPNC